MDNVISIVALLVGAVISYHFCKQKNKKKKESNKFILVAFGAAAVVFISWVGLLFFVFSKKVSFDSDLAELGQVGDFFNILTSLSAVFTVAIISYGVYLQKSELKAVREQLLEQTKSTEKEHRKNRTFKIFEEWNTAVGLDHPKYRAYSKESINDLNEKIKTEYTLLSESHRWKIVQRLLVSHINNSEYLSSYIDLKELRAYISVDILGEIITAHGFCLNKLYTMDKEVEDTTSREDASREAIEILLKKFDAILLSFYNLDMHYNFLLGNTVDEEQIRKKISTKINFKLSPDRVEINRIAFFKSRNSMINSRII